MEGTRFIKTVTLIATLVATAASAQSGAPGPAGAGTGSGRATEARGAEAVLANPALLGIFDGPEKSWHLLNFQGDASLALGAWDVRNFFLKDENFQGSEFVADKKLGRALSRWNDTRSGKSDVSVSGTAHILGVHRRGLALTLQSGVWLAPHIRDSVAAFLLGDQGAARMSATGDRPTRYASATTAAVGFGGHYGGEDSRNWAGITLKGSLVHSSGVWRVAAANAIDLNAAGDGTGAIFQPGDNGVQVSDVRVGNIAVYGVDIGFTSSPTKTQLLSVNAVNIIQVSRAPTAGNMIEVTQAGIPGLDVNGRLVGTGSRGFFNGQTVPDAALGDATLATRAAAFTPLIRVSGSGDFMAGRLLWSYAKALNDRPAIDREAQERWSIGVAGRGNISPRLSLSSRLGGERAVEIAVATMGCGMRLMAGGTVSLPVGGSARGSAMAGVSFGQGSCRAAGR